MNLVCGEGYIPITEKNENEYDTNLIKGEAKEKLSEGIEKAITISYKIYWADTNFEKFYLTFIND